MSASIQQPEPTPPGGTAGGRRWPLVAFGGLRAVRQRSQHQGQGAGQPPPPGDELRSHKARSAQQEGFMLAINQETQTAPFPAEITAETGTRGLWGGC